MLLGSTVIVVSWWRILCERLDLDLHLEQVRWKEQLPAWLVLISGPLGRYSPRHELIYTIVTLESFEDFPGRQTGVFWWFQKSVQKRFYIMKHKVDLTFPKIKWRAAPPFLPWSSAQGTVPRYQAVGRPCSKGQSSVCPGLPRCKRHSRPGRWLRIVVFKCRKLDSGTWPAQTRLLCATLWAL